MGSERNWQALYAPTSNDQNVPDFLVHSLPITKVEISISAKNLLNLDTFSKSDPQCIVFMKESLSQPYREIGKTEVIQDNLNPDFVQKIIVDYNFEMVQYLKFELWDIDYRDHDFLGRVETTLPDIVANKSKQFRKPLIGVNSKKNCGELILVVEEVSACKQIVEMKFMINNLRTNAFLSCLIKPNSFLKFWRSNEDGSFSLIYSTRVKWSSRNPQFDSIEIKVRELCNADFYRNIKIEVLNYSATGNHKSIGSVFTTLDQLLNNNLANKSFNIVDEQKKINGLLELQNIRLSNGFSFFDYLRAGMEMHFAVAIDFTNSNGPSNWPNSLHYVDTLTNKPNSYEIALKAIGDIIQYYSTSKMFPGFGFGAKVPPENIVSHKFPLNGDMAKPYCEGIDQLLYYYKQTINNVVLYGPTNFAPIIDYTASIASKNPSSKNYFILLIITDGIICDMPQTMRAIIKASSLPLSIIIVGVGDADFSAMNELDSDDKALELDGKKAVRDIVQFVTLNKHLRNDGSYIQSQADLAREVLYEIPDQVESYMKLRGFKPDTSNILPTAPSYQ